MRAEFLGVGEGEEAIDGVGDGGVFRTEEGRGGFRKWLGTCAEELAEYVEDKDGEEKDEEEADGVESRHGWMMVEMVWRRLLLIPSFIAVQRPSKPTSKAY